MEKNENNNIGVVKKPVRTPRVKKNQSSTLLMAEENNLLAQSITNAGKNMVREISKTLITEHENKSTSVELTTSQMDELIFRLERAKQPYRQYMHKSIQVDKNHNLSEEAESRMIIINTFDSFKSLNMILNDTVPIVVEYDLFEICVYENILVDERPNIFYKIDKAKTKFKNVVKLLDPRRGFRWLFQATQNTLEIGIEPVAKVYLMNEGK